LLEILKEISKIPFENKPFSKNIDFNGMVGLCWLLLSPLSEKPK